MRSQGSVPIRGNIFHWIFLFSRSKASDANIDIIAIFVHFEETLFLSDNKKFLLQKIYPVGFNVAISGSSVQIYHPRMQTPPDAAPLDHTPWRQSPPPEADLPWMQTTLEADPWRQISLEAGHVTCDPCLEANPPVNRQTGVKTLPCPKLRLRAITSIFTALFYAELVSVMNRSHAFEVILKALQEFLTFRGYHKTLMKVLKCSSLTIYLYFEASTRTVLLPTILLLVSRFKLHRHISRYLIL